MICQTLKELKAADNLRQLPEIGVEGKYILHQGCRYLNLSSNDYLGVTSEAWYRDFMTRAAQSDAFLLSNPSSRLITGNSPDYDTLECALSELYGGRAALVLGSGYLANTGILPALTTKEDLILADKWVHASLIDGLQLSQATWRRFAHNDIEHLERLLKRDRSGFKEVWVVSESLFSMDGDQAPLEELVRLKKKYNLKLYLDEAHAFGVYGARGQGCAVEKGLLEEVDILVGTLGKAIASQGGFVICEQLTRKFLINRMRTLIFSTALPPLSLGWANEVIRRLPQMGPQRKHLQKLVQIVGGSAYSSHIIPIMAGENRRAIELSEQMREAGYWVTPIRYPTVPKGSARIRISLSAALSEEEATQFAALCRAIGV